MAAAIAREISPEAAEKEWSAGKLRPVYLFVGEDSAGKARALSSLRAVVKVDDFNISDFSGEIESQAAEIVSLCRTAPMFSERRFVLVREIKLGLSGRKLLSQYLRDPLESTVLVLLSSERKADAKDAVMSAAAERGALVFFGPLRPEQAAQRLQEEARRTGFTISPAAAELIVEEVGSEWGILQGELEKIRIFLNGRPSAPDESILACLGYRPETGPFDFSNALEDGDARLALRVLRRKLEEDENESFGMLRQLSNHLRKRLQAKRMIQAGVPRFEMFGKLRVFGFRQDRFLSSLQKESEARLLSALKACLQTEVALKSKSWLDRRCELERLTAWILRLKS
ncbi:MAG: DNA polymerase III subunit delta [Elusimicrobiota bacterium]|jgi:DNA polymerase-3 subunit delta